MTPLAKILSRLCLLAAWLLSVGYPCAALLGQSNDQLTGRSRLSSRLPAAEPTTPFRRSPTLKPAPGPVGDPRLARLDPATRLLVETELRDASPAEREQWLTLIAGVAPNQIPFLLDSRRRAAGGLNASPMLSIPRRRVAEPAIAPVSRTTISTEPVSDHSTTFNAPAPQVEQPPASESQPLTSGTSIDSPTEAAPATPPPHRRWIAPLRGRWGENRNDAAPESIAPASEPPPDSPETAHPRSTAYMNVELQRVMSLLRTELVEAEKSGLTTSDSAYRRMHVQMRLLHLLADEPEQALQAIPNFPPEQQEFWIQYLWALHNELDIAKESNPSDRLHRTSELVAAARHHLDQAAPLDIPKAVFCHRISSYGSYESFAHNEFQPGQPLLIYAEVENFHSELQIDNLYRTRMRTVVEILPVGPDGLPPPTAVALSRREFPATEDISRSLRRDYFHSYRIDLPQQLAAGSYVLRLSLTDELAGKSAHTILPFAIR